MQKNNSLSDTKKDCYSSGSAFMESVSRDEEIKYFLLLNSMDHMAPVKSKMFFHVAQVSSALNVEQEKNILKSGICNYRCASMKTKRNLMIKKVSTMLR